MFRYREPVSVDDLQQTNDHYTCSNCGEPLFEGSKKFDVGSGFPSFWDQLGESVQHKQLDTYGRSRTQLLCKNCGQHLGHLFEDTRTPTQVRYCISNTAITYIPE